MRRKEIHLRATQREGALWMIEKSPLKGAVIQIKSRLAPTVEGEEGER